MYSLDFRKRVFAIKKKERLTFIQTSKRFSIGIRTLFAWQKKIEPRLTRNKSATKINMEALAEDVKNYPDDFQWERAKKFKVSQRGIGYALMRLNLSYKKTLFHPRADVVERIRFQTKI